MRENRTGTPTAAILLLMQDKSSPESSSSPASSPSNNAENMAESNPVAAVQLPVVLRHHVFKDGKWFPKSAKPHPTVKLTAFTRKLDYNFFGLKHVPMKTQDLDAVTDSGAQVCLWGWSDCMRAGLKRSDLIATQQKLHGVCKSSIKIYGAILLRTYGISSEGEKITCAAMVYISPNVSGFYLSDGMLQLKIIPQNFPHVGSAASITTEDCPCTPRSKTPGRPSQLPMEVCEENIAAMEQWLRERYASSTFNSCPHQPIPSIQGPPLRIRIDHDAEPKQSFTRTPLHWREQTDADLDKEVLMKVIEKVPRGKPPPQWIHPCVYTRKPNG